MNNRIYKMIWRFVAIVCMFASGIVLVFNAVLYMSGYEIPKNNIFTPLTGIISCSITMLMLIVLVVYPLQFRLYAFLCFVWGIVSLIDGASSLGLLMYILGTSFAFRAGFFQKHIERRILLVIFLPIFAIIPQVRFGINKVILSIIHLFSVGLIFSLIFLLIFPVIRKLGKKPTRNSHVVYLPAERFSAKDIRCLKKVQDGEKYESIAKDEDIGLSTLKKKIKTIYQSLDVYDRTSFLSTYAGYTFLLKPANEEKGK